MSTLAGKLGNGYIGEDASQQDKQISTSGINKEVSQNEIKATPFVDITREQWFWDKAVMS